MEFLGTDQGTNIIIGILTLAGMLVVIVIGILNKLGLMTFGKKSSSNGEHQVSMKELIEVLNKNLHIKECPLHAPLLISHEKLMKEVDKIHNRQIKNISLHERSSEKLNGMNKEFSDIKKLLGSIDKKVAILTCLINRSKFYSNGQCKELKHSGDEV